MRDKILFGINPKNHITLGFDELEGLSDLGFECRSVNYGNGHLSKGVIKRFIDVSLNAFKIIGVLHSFKPAILYLNSRLEPVAAVRDFFSLLIIKCLYYKKLKIIIKSHGSDPSIFHKKSIFYTYFLMPYMTRSINAWLFLSIEEIMIIKKYNSNLANKSFTTCNIIKTSRSVPSSAFKIKHGLLPTKFNILFVGRITSEKGVFDIINSIPLLNCKDHCAFIFVGDGPDLNNIQIKSEQLNLSSYIKFLGHFNDEECDHFYANADILLFPTFFNEGFPMALFKSIAAGLPVITTKTRASVDHLTTPNNVIWVEPRSEKDIAAAVEKLFKDKELREFMSYNNKLLGENFTQNKICKQMQEVFISAY